MSNPAVRTVLNVESNIACASICVRQTEPACVTAQIDKGTQNCALFSGFEHTHDPSNETTTILFKFAARFFEK
ncbi:hypothetical protein DPMN_023017 [Dreissena polymorpha]|uniref:Uncharacterized protein n=1 Tax=Dreissena polymorpha TaxID=45954 RepID=A0A9D4LNU9_DREPO|nr:hypothetical protein DPMN_023017 [Dreissena polymorpha]